LLNTHMKDTLRKGNPVFGTFLKCNSPALVETYGRAGFDFVILDAEHGTYTFSEAENLVRAADSVNMSSIILIPGCTEASVLHGLDIGAGGVQVPSLTRVEDARFGAQFSRYFPQGIRGLASDQRAGDYGM
jgi:4-hydroxy-2-oxoheptanedioate aldolase